MAYRHHTTATIIAMAVAFALAMGSLALTLTFIAHTVEANASEARASGCPLRIATTEDPALVGVTQARLEAQRTFALYEFNGLSDEPRIVGHLEPGDTFCLSESDLDWGLTITEGTQQAPIGLIRTPEHPDGVYSGAAGNIPTIQTADAEAAHRIIPLRLGQGWIARPADSPTLPESAVLAATLGQAEKSGAVSGLTASDVLGLH